MESAWPSLFKYVVPISKNHLCEEHLYGLSQLELDPYNEPDPVALSDKVFRETGWELVRARGEVPAAEFFSMLATKKFPIVHELRPLSSVFASAEPDLWHEVFGHVPFLWNQAMTEIYQMIGKAAGEALRDGNEARFAEVSRLYWFICEYGLVLEDGAPKMIGAGLIGSPLGPYKLTLRDSVKMSPFSLEQLSEEEMNPYQFQGRLFSFKSLGHAHDEVSRIAG